MYLFDSKTFFLWNYVKLCVTHKQYDQDLENAQKVLNYET
jgi:hypothetical protein